MDAKTSIAKAKVQNEEFLEDPFSKKAKLKKEEVHHKLVGDFKPTYGVRMKNLEKQSRAG